jgi:hypothetical protein
MLSMANLFTRRVSIRDKFKCYLKSSYPKLSDTFDMVFSATMVIKFTRFELPVAFVRRQHKVLLHIALRASDWWTGIIVGRRCPAGFRYTWRDGPCRRVLNRAILRGYIY